MGEYAKFNGQQIKIGTCEAMYYLRYEDRHRVQPQPGNINPGIDKDLWFRPPFPDEDHLKPGEYLDPFRGQPLYKSTEKGHVHFTEKFEEHGNIQLHSDCGMHVNAKCFHGAKLPQSSEDMQPFWNGKAGVWFELVHIKNSAVYGLIPIIRCKHCDSKWSFTPDEWPRILEYVPDTELRKRLELYIEFENVLSK